MPKSAGAGWVRGQVGSGVVEREASSFFLPLVTGPRRSLSVELSDTIVYGPQTRARLVTTKYFCEVLALNFAGELCGQAGSGVAEREPARCCPLLALRSGPGASTLESRVEGKS